VIRHPPGTESTVWLVTGNPRIDHVHVCSGTTSVIRNGSQIPTGVRTRPARPAYNGRPVDPPRRHSGPIASMFRRR
jgi:hypothetical protein